MKKIIVSVILSVVMLFGVSTPVLATVASPDSLSLEGVWAYQDNYESGDMTFIFYYNAYYSSTEPDDLAETTLLLRLLSGSTELGHTLPPDNPDNGYNRGVAGLYFTAAEVTALGLVWGSAYNATLEPNPLVTWNPSTPTKSSSGITWDSATTQKGAQTNLGNRIITLALILKGAWGANLAEAPDGLNYILTSSSSTVWSGQDYFIDVLSNLRQLAPQIFSTQLSPPVFKTTSAPQVYAPDELPVDPTTAATIFGMNKGTMTSLMAMLALLMFSMYLVARSPFLTRYVVLIDGTCVVYFTRIGALVPVWATLVGVIALLIIGIVMFYQPSSA